MLKERIKSRRLAKNRTLLELAEYLGVAEATVQRYESGEIKNIKYDTICKIADYLECSPAYLMGWEDNSRLKGVQINVLGKIAAGTPIEAVEEVVETIEISREMAKGGEFFGLVIKGDSMAPRLVDGDVIIVRRQQDVDNGAMAVVMVDEKTATVKCVKKSDAGITLLPINPAYPATHFNWHEVETLPVKILGMAVEVRGKLQTCL